LKNEKGESDVFPMLKCCVSRVKEHISKKNKLYDNVDVILTVHRR